MATTRTPDEIRSAVARSYGDRVRPVLERDQDLAIEVIPAGSGTSCCGDSGCGPGAGGAISNIARLYAGEDLGSLPESVTGVAFGCGNPAAIEALRPGEIVLDLGSGGGIDCFLAARAVGLEGFVFGVDMTPEMVALANKNRVKAGATNVEFRLGQIEAIPLADATVDVIISNCVINLSPDKDAVFREAFRVLRPGGRLQVSDIVWTKPAPAEIRDDMEEWAGCVAGALLESEYVAKIAAAGFVEVASKATGYAGGRGIASADVVAKKPR